MEAYEEDTQAVGLPVRDPDYVEDFITKQAELPPEEANYVFLSPDGGRLDSGAIIDGFKRRTTGHGIGNYNQARGFFKRFFWFMAILGTVFAVFYNLINIATLFLGRHTDFQIQVAHKTSLPFPAVTLCNINPLKKSEVRKMAARRKRRKRAAGNCESGWTSHDQQCYYMSTTTLSWQDARASCVAMDADLVIFEDAAESSALLPYLTSGEEYWIGLDTFDGSWEWQDGSSPTYTLWTPGEPNGSGDCGRLVSTGNWKDMSCSSLYRYVCEKAMSVTTTVETTTAPSTTEQVTTTIPTTTEEATTTEKMTSTVTTPVQTTTEEITTTEQLTTTIETTTEEITTTEQITSTVTTPAQTTTEETTTAEQLTTTVSIPTTTIEDPTTTTTLSTTAETTTKMDTTSKQTTAVTQPTTEPQTTVMSQPTTETTQDITPTIPPTSETAQPTSETAQASSVTTKASESTFSSTEQAPTTQDATTANSTHPTTEKSNQPTFDNTITSTTTSMTTSNTTTETCCCMCCPSNPYQFSCGKCQGRTVTEAATCAINDVQTPQPNTAETYLPTEPSETTTPHQDLTTKSVREDAMTSDFITSENVIEKMAQFTPEEMDSISFPFDSSVLDCRFAGINCDSSWFAEIQNPVHGKCYVFNSGWNGTKSMKWSTKTGVRYGLHLILNIQQAEYLEGFSDTAGVRIVVHSQDRMPFPEDEGMTVSPGKATSVGLKQVNVNYLPDPYGDCIDPTLDHSLINVYEEVYPVTYSIQACQKTCFQRHVISRCGCGDPYHPLEGKAVSNVTVPVCSLDNQEQVSCRDKISDEYRTQGLDCVCPDPCSHVAFTQEFSIGKWPSLVQKDTILQNLSPKIGSTFDIADSKAYAQNLVKLEVFFKDFNHELVREKVKYTWGSCLSGVGGAMSLWVGFSIFTVVEVLEMGLDLAVFWVWSCMADDQEKTKK